MCRLRLQKSKGPLGIRLTVDVASLFQKKGILKSSEVSRKFQTVHNLVKPLTKFQYGFCLEENMMMMIMFFILHNTLIYKFLVCFRLIFFEFQNFGCVFVFLSVVFHHVLCCSFYDAVGIPEFMKSMIERFVNDGTEGMWKESVLK